MKVGDYFLSSIGTEWRLVYDTHCDRVRPQAIPEGDIYGPGCSVKDQQDISKEEFCKIYMFNEENLPHLKLKNGEPLFPEETYNIGDIFVMTDTGDENYRPAPEERYMLVHVNGIKALVSLSTGNYWMTGKEMGFIIKKDDLKSISGRATFEKVKQRV